MVGQKRLSTDSPPLRRCVAGRQCTNLDWLMLGSKVVAL